MTNHPSSIFEPWSTDVAPSVEPKASSEKMVTIGIRGAILANKGAETMLKTTARELSTRLPSRFVVAPRHPFPQPVDLIVDISGFAYSSRPRWGTHAVREALTVRSAHPNVPWLFLPQTFGPFAPDMVAPLRRLFNDALVVARDGRSYEQLSRLGGSFQLMQSTDITWGFPGNQDRGTELLANLGLDPAQPLIGISPNMRVQETIPGYLDKLRQLTAACQSLAQVVLIPHEITPQHPDDRTLCRQLPAPALLDHYSAEELKGVIGHCDMLVGSRYHALVGALSQAVPVVAIGWASKYESLLSEFSLTQFVVEDLNKAEHHVSECWQHRELLQRQIEARAAQKREEVQGLFDKVTKYVRPSASSVAEAVDAPLKIGLARNRAGQGDLFNFRRNIHRLEKGLIVSGTASHPRVFAAEYLPETIEYLGRNLGNTAWADGTRDWGIQTLVAYFRLFPNSPLKQRFESITGGEQVTPSPAPYPAGSRPPLQITSDNFSALCHRRRSIRCFEDRTPARDDLRKALAMALQAPSACNRQSFRLQYYDDREMIDRIARIPYGARDLKFPGLLVFIACYEGYSEARDVKCPIIDASLAAMSLMFALETFGMSSLPVNFPEVEHMRQEVKAACRLEPSEIVVMLMGVGYADPSGLVAVSSKRDIKHVLSINPHLQ